jgi:glycosyltransferase involved in cell wall biosynthesis
MANGMRVAIVHYWLVNMRGGERVLEQLCDIFPEAEIFTHVVDHAALSPALRRRVIHTSFIARLPFARRHYQKYLPLMPRALEALNLSAYDLVISCEAGPAKGVITRPDALHLTYCHSPMRYIWDQYHQYAAQSGWAARLMMALFAPALRQWDTASAARSDMVLANSHYVAARIRKAWGRVAQVVHPPVETGLFAPSEQVGEEYLWVGQLVPYKRPDLAVAAFAASGRRLHVVGEGSMLARLKAMTAGVECVRFSPRLSFDGLRRAYAESRALVFTAEEDFGLVPIEVMASGRPVLALGKGGALETVVPGLTGQFYAENSVEALAEALDAFEAWLPGFRSEDAVARATEFSPQRFRAGVEAAVSIGFADLRACLSPPARRREVAAEPAGFMLRVEQV